MAEPKRGSGVLILVAVLVLGVLTFMYSGGNYVKSLAGIGSCTETPLATFPSPGQRLAVSSYLRQCGPGTDPVTHVILHPVGKLPPADANGLVREGEVFLESGKRAVGASWEGEREVTLEVGGTGAIPGAAEKTRADVQVHIRRAR
ncbi:hypothetical protein [Massilia sp. CF038]|uniref:hypothetical protein n=1 Tax=Massilia sp. CF038 TaxID=1881045 RepID=UPI00091CBF82|nr:hypothetical protein [Massilia sp. CF038]SHH13051.1 hypothetical protein SAMN05428948_2934 [Massilia sp. CF038]